MRVRVLLLFLACSDLLLAVTAFSSAPSLVESSRRRSSSTTSQRHRQDRYHAHPSHHRCITYHTIGNSLKDAETSTLENQSSVNLATGILGPPEPLRSLAVGASIRAFRSPVPPTPKTTPTIKVGSKNHNQNRTIGDRHDFEIERLSIDPPIYLLRGVLTEQECEWVCTMGQSQDHPMVPAQTVTEGDTTSRKQCHVAWLHHPWTQSLAQSLANLFLSKTVRSHPQSGVENLQVLEYTAPGGEFVLHHDGPPRVLTILYYLNGIGETWFPLADYHTNYGDDEGDGFDKLRTTERPRTKQEAVNLCPDNPQSLGLIIGGGGNHRRHSVRPGDAVAFYNYLDDGGVLNWNAIHAGLPVTGDTNKWVANHWFCYGGFPKSKRNKTISAD